MYPNTIIRKVNSTKNKISILRYSIFNLFRKNVGITKEKKKKELIISLTTYPNRFKFVYIAIESLLNQIIKPNKIILWLSKKEVNYNDIPKSILRLKQRGLTIRLVDENLKSYKKLIYTLKEFKYSDIITCDDDTIYPNYFIGGLYNTSNKYPNCVVAYRCATMQKVHINQLAPYLSWKNSETRGPSFNLFPTGVGGVLYPPHSLNQEIFNKEIFLKLCPLSDDIWFKAMTLLNNRQTVMVKNKSIEFPIITGSQNDALWHTNVCENKNDEQLKNVFDHYNLYDYISK